MSRRKDQGERLRTVREMYEAGSSLEAIAEVIGCKPKTVNQMLSKAGVERVRRTEKYRDEIFRLRNAGKSLDYIAKETGFTKETISKFLNKNGMGIYKTVKDRMAGNTNLIDENTVFAEEVKETVERFLIGGKWYVTVPESEIFQS